MAYDMTDFRVDVLEASNAIPVVIDFWAEWCGPCRVLGPVLEKLASQAQGKWKLVKINTEEHPQIAAQFQIRSIPAVKMVHNGAIVAEFVGALPEAQIKSWLDQHIPGNQEQAILEERIDQLIAEGNRLAARDMLAELFASNPNSKEMAAKLAMLALPDRIEDARSLLSMFKDDASFEIERDTILFYEYIRIMPDNSSFTGNPQAVSFYTNGCTAMREGNHELALEQFIESMMRDRTVDEDGARRACIAIFSMLGDSHETTKAWRRRFSMALY
jgi:putative thioredoxin